MNELAVIAAETHEKAVAYFNVAEQYAYKSIMEIKGMRDKQYYKALGFNSFNDYCEKAWNVRRDFMDERILIAEAFGNDWDFDGTYRQLGHSKSLILARMEPERREEILSHPQQLPNGMIKTANEMTVAEMKQLEKKVEAAEKAKEVAEMRAKQFEVKHALAVNQHTEQQEKLLAQIAELKKSKASDRPETIKRIKELEQELKEYQHDAEQHRKLKTEIMDLNTKKDDLNRQIESAISLARLSVQIEDMLRTHLAPIRYSRALTEQRDSQAAMQNLSEIIELVEGWCSEMRRLMPNNYIDVEVNKL